MIPILILAAVTAAIVMACIEWRIAAPLLIVLAIPLGDRTIPSGPLPLQLIDVVTGIVVSVVVVRRLLAGGTPLSLPWLALPLVTLPILAVVSTVQSVDVGLSLRQTVQIVFGVLLSLAVASSVVDDRQRMIVVSVFCIVGGGVCLWGAFDSEATRVLDSGSLITNRATGIFAQANELGAFAAVVTAMGLALTMTRGNRFARSAGYWGLAGGIGATVVALSRGSMVGIALAVVVFAVLLADIRLRILTVASLVLLTLVIAGAGKVGPTSLQIAGDRVATIVTGNENPYDERPAIYAEAQRQIRERPLFGSGPGSFPIASGVGKQPGLSLSTAEFHGLPVTVGADHAHNVLLTVGAEMGLLGIGLAVAFTMLLGSALLRVSRRAAVRNGQVVIAGLAAALSTFVGQGLVDFTLRNPIVFATLWLMVGLALGTLLSSRQSASTRSWQA